MKRRITGLSAGLLLAFASHAQAPASTPAAAMPATIVLKAAHLFDGRSGRISEPGLVVVQGKRILGVGAGTAIPAGSRIIDLGDATLVVLAERLDITQVATTDKTDFAVYRTKTGKHFINLF